MTWHYQIIEHKYYFGLHEVYRNEDGTSLWTENPIFIGESRDEIIELLEMALRDSKAHKTAYIQQGILLPAGEGSL